MPGELAKQLPRNYLRPANAKGICQAIAKRLPLTKAKHLKNLDGVVFSFGFEGF
jgi:hypothetical protein